MKNMGIRRATKGRTLESVKPLPKKMVQQPEVSKTLKVVDMNSEEPQDTITPLNSSMVPAIVFKDISSVEPYDIEDVLDSKGGVEIPRIRTTYPVVNANMYRGVRRQLDLSISLHEKGIESDIVDGMIGAHVKAAAIEAFTRRMDFVYNTALMATLQFTQSYFVDSKEYNDVVTSFGNDINRLALGKENGIGSNMYNPLSGGCPHMIDSIIRGYLCDIDDILSRKKISNDEIQKELSAYILSAESYNMNVVLAAIINGIFDRMSNYASTIIFGDPRMKSDTALAIYSDMLESLTAFINGFVPSIVAGYSEAMDIVMEILKLRVQMPLTYAGRYY